MTASYPMTFAYNGDWDKWPAERKRLERAGWRITAINGRLISARGPACP